MENETVEDHVQRSEPYLELKRLYQDHSAGGGSLTRILIPPLNFFPKFEK